MLPYMFLFLDTESNFEQGMRMMYDERYLNYTASDFEPTGKLTNNHILRILQSCLLTTIGDHVKKSSPGTL